MEKEAFAREEDNKAYHLREELKRLAEERRKQEQEEQRRKDEEEKARQEERMENNRLQALRILEKRKKEDRQILEYLKKNGF